MNVFRTICVSLAVATFGVGVAHALVRDSVRINIQGQTRILRLVSDDARVETSMPCGANPTGVTLRGHFRLEMTRPDGSICGKVELGEMPLEHGKGWSDRKVLMLGDWNGDGRLWEVLYYAGDAMSNGHSRGMAGYDAQTGSLRRVRFRLRKGTVDSIWGVWDPRAVRYERPFLRILGYDNSFSRSSTGYYENRYRWEAKSFAFVFSGMASVQEPPNLWYPET